VSFRWGGTDKINVQNLSSRGAKAGALKRSILAPTGCLYMDSDSSQIEARTLAWFACQDDLVEAFREKRDIYSEMASDIYGRPIDRKRVALDEAGLEFHPDKTEGMVGKTAILSGGFGASGTSMQNMLRVMGGVIVTIEEAQHIINVYRARYPAIPRLWWRGNDVIEAMYHGRTMGFGRDGLVKVERGRLLMPNGLPILYPQLHRERNEETGYDEWYYMQGPKRTKLYGAKIVENVIQCLARCIVGSQMLKVSKQYHVVNTVHDSIGCVVPVALIEHAKTFVTEVMRTPPAWAPGLPLDCEVGVGRSYGDC
jgi:DNA polymerase